MSLYPQFDPMTNWSEDDIREILFPILINPEDIERDSDYKYYRDWQYDLPYSSVNWASYPLLEGQVKLVNMWKDEVLENVQSVMSSLMLRCTALEVVHWWIGDFSQSVSGIQCDWVWRRAKRIMQGNPSEAVYLLNDLRIPNTPNAPRKKSSSVFVGRMADYESNLL